MRNNLDVTKRDSMRRRENCYQVDQDGDGAIADTGDDIEMEEPEI
jgi:hypothetical protein